MSIALTEDHRALGQTASDFLTRRDARGTARALLLAQIEGLPPFWDDLVALGWLGLHLPEARGVRASDCPSSSWWSKSSAAPSRPAPSCRP